MATKGLRAAQKLRRLQIAVVNSHLTSVRGCLLVGHYGSSGWRQLPWSMRLPVACFAARWPRGLYPDEPGMHQVFVNEHRDTDNPWLDPRLRAAIVVGLGDEGRLSGRALAGAVSAAVAGLGRAGAGRRTPKSPWPGDDLHPDG